MTTIVSPALISDQILHVRDEKASGTAGGSFTSGAWRTRDLNTTKTNTITGASLASNQITLPTGVYTVVAHGAVKGVDMQQMRFQNITDASTELIGMVLEANSASGVSVINSLNGVITLTASKVFELQHRCGSTRATDGLGKAGSFGTEVYADVFITKVG